MSLLVAAESLVKAVESVDEILTESDTAFESATDAATPAEVAALLAVESGTANSAVDWAIEISVLCDTSRLTHAESFVEFMAD